MRRIALVLAAAAALSGCAHRPIAVENEFDAASPGPLTVRLLPPTNGTLRFLTSEPAYVAVFEVAPDRGVSLLYPGSGKRAAEISAAGYNAEFLPWRNEGRWFYAAAPYYSAASTFSRPKYLYVIASRSPLPIDDIRLSPASLRTALGWHSFLATNLSETLDDLERLVAGSLNEEDWSSDLYVLWPDTPRDVPWQSQYVLMSCADGRVVVVPLGWNISACPGTTNLAQATKPTTPPTTPPGTPPGTEPDTDSSAARGEPGQTGGGRGGAIPPRAVDRIPAESPIGSRRSEGATRAEDAPGRAERVERHAAANEPRRTPESRSPEPRSAPTPAPAPRQDPPRSEPRPAPQPQRSEPAPSAPAPSEPAVPQEPRTP